MQASKISYNDKGLIDGEHRTYFDDGNICQIYNFKDETPHGLQTEYYHNGNKLGECTFTEGKRDGLFTEWYESGTINYQVTYQNDNEIGNGILYNPNGTVKFTIDFDQKVYLHTDDNGNITTRPYHHTHWRKRNVILKKYSSTKNIPA